MTVIGVQRTTDILNLSKYVTGVAINKNGESSGVLSGTSVFAGIQGGSWLWKHRKNIPGGLRDLTAEMSSNKAIMKGAAQKGKGIWNTIKNFWRGGSEIVSKGKLEAIAQGTSQNAAAAQSVLNSGKNFTQGLKAVEGTTSITKSLAKGIKGNAWFAGISFGLGVVTDVIPAFKLGTDKGVKQLGKTAVKTAAEVGGWAAGSALGAKAGAAVGACIGGPVGAAIGGIIGLAGGFLGSFLCSKAADKVVGPSEVEKAQQEGAQELAQEASAGGDETVSQVAQAAYDKLLQSAAANGGKLSEDDLTAKKSLENLIGEKIDIQADLAQLSSSGGAEQITNPQASAQQTGAQTTTAQASGEQASGAQAATAQASGAQASGVAQSTTQQDDLPSTSAAMYGMTSFNPFAMSAMPSMMTPYMGMTNPFGSGMNNDYDLYAQYPMGYRFRYNA